MFVTDSVTGRLQDETWYIANTLRTSTGYVKYKTDIYRKRTAFFCPVISVTTFEHVQNSLPYMPDIDWHGTHLTDDNSIYTVYIPYFNGYQRTGKKGVRFLSVSSIRWYVTGPLGSVLCLVACPCISPWYGSMLNIHIHIHIIPTIVV